MTCACRLFLLLTLIASTACVRRPRAASIAPPRPAVEVNAAVEAEASGDGDRDVEDATRAIEFYLMRRVVPGETTLPLDRYNVAREHTRQMPSVSLPAMSHKAVAAVSGNAWTSVGPGNVGGRTRSLVINPQNPNIMYAGAVTGGVWKTTEAETSGRR